MAKDKSKICPLLYPDSMCIEDGCVWHDGEMCAMVRIGNAFKNKVRVSGIRKLEAVKVMLQKAINKENNGLCEGDQ
jgi:hypothetical protein